MKKYEKFLMILFGGGVVLSAASVLYIWLVIEKELGYFDDVTTVLPFWGFFVSLFGVSAVMISWRLRKRAETGKKPISRLYKCSFILSFVPFVILVIFSACSSADGFTFMSSTVYGSEAFYEYMVWSGIIIFGLLIPVFPLMIFWQVLYIIKRIQYRKMMRVVSDECIVIRE